MPRPQGHPLNVAAWDDVLKFRGMSLTRVSERSGIARGTLSYLLASPKPAQERGKRPVRPRASDETVVRIAEVLRVDPMTLFPTYGTNRPFRPPVDFDAGAEDDEPDAEAA